MKKVHYRKFNFFFIVIFSLFCALGISFDLGLINLFRFLLVGEVAHVILCIPQRELYFTSPTLIFHEFCVFTRTWKLHLKEKLWKYFPDEFRKKRNWQDKFSPNWWWILSCLFFFACWMVGILLISLN
jgi:hypothetical protein